MNKDIISEMTVESVLKSLAITEIGHSIEEDAEMLHERYVILGREAGIKYMASIIGRGELYSNMSDDGITTRKIASHFNVSKTTVIDYIAIYKGQDKLVISSDQDISKNALLEMVKPPKSEDTFIEAELVPDRSHTEDEKPKEEESPSEPFRVIETEVEQLKILSEKTKDESFTVKDLAELYKSMDLNNKLNYQLIEANKELDKTQKELSKYKAKYGELESPLEEVA